MQPTREITGTALPLDRSDVDTDQIIPADWLKRVERTGFDKGLFAEWRDDRLHLAFSGQGVWGLKTELAQKFGLKRDAIHTTTPDVGGGFGTKGFNYENNLEYMKFLDSLKIPYQKLIVEDAPHSAGIIYEKRGLEILQFHAKNFEATAGQ